MLWADSVSFAYRTRGDGARAAGRAAGTAQGTGAGVPRGAGASTRGALEPGRWAGLRDVSVRVKSGSRVGLLGANGSGKTTLLRILAGILRPSGGRVELDGADLRRLSRRQVARKVAVVPQETHLSFDYSVMEIALMGRHPHLGAFELEGADDVAIAHDALAATGTSSLEHRSFATLSGGEKQRVIIASAVAQQAGLLLLDEPTSSLDLGYQLEIAALLRRLNAERAITMVIATHDLNFAASVCDELVLIRDGMVLDAGRVGDVLTRERIGQLYQVDAEVGFHPGAGHVTVIPMGRLAPPQTTGGDR